MKFNLALLVPTANVMKLNPPGNKNNYTVCYNYIIFADVVFFINNSPRVLSHFRGGGIAYLNDPDSYAGWSLYSC